MFEKLVSDLMCLDAKMLMIGRVSWVAPHRTGNTGSTNQLRPGYTFSDWEATEQPGKAQRCVALAKFYPGQAWARRKKPGKVEAGKALSVFSVFSSFPGKAWKGLGSCDVWALLD